METEVHAGNSGVYQSPGTAIIESNSESQQRGD